MTKLSRSDIREFRGYLRNCTDSQVVGVWKKEKEAGRTEYMRLAEAEAYRRDIPYSICREMFT